MNIYEKLQKMRLELQELNIEKHGKNTFAKYEYFELADFLPHINKLMMDNKVTSVISFTKEMATLTLIDIDKPDSRIEFTSPMAEAKLKGVHEIQNLGAVETYQRRYLYIVAFEIVEADILDSGKVQPASTVAPQQSQQAVIPEYITDTNMLNDNPYAELCRLWAFAQWPPNDIQGYVQQWAARKNIQLDDTAYKAIFGELKAYLIESGMRIDYIPFK